MQVVGHRGAAGEAPENTIAGFRHAIERGVRHVEFDVRLSKDNQLVVVHDSTVNRTTQHKGAVNKYSAAELKKMDGRKNGPPWPNKRQTGIPTLEALIRATPEMKSYNIEVKPGPKKSVWQIAEMLAEKYPFAKEARNVIVTSSDLNCLDAMKELGPHIDRGFVSTDRNPFAILEKYQCRYLSAAWNTLTPKSVSKAHSLGYAVTTWTVNDASVIKNLLEMKIESIITDFPSMAIPLLGRLMKR